MPPGDTRVIEETGDEGEVLPRLAPLRRATTPETAPWLTWPRLTGAPRTRRLAETGSGDVGGRVPLTRPDIARREEEPETRLAETASARLACRNWGESPRLMIMAIIRVDYGHYPK